MRKSIKTIAALLAAVTAISCSSVSAFADKLKVVDGVRYVYTDDGKPKGKYSGWTQGKSGAKYYYKNGVRLKNSWLSVKGVKTYLFDKSGKMVTGEYTTGTKTYLFGSDGKLIYGIQAKGSKTSRTGMKLSLNGIALGDTNADVWTGEEYWLEVQNASGKWSKQALKGDVFWNDVGLPFFSDGKLIQRTETINWQDMYGKLTTGEYRLCKNYYVQLSPTSSIQKKTLYVPFSVKVFNSAESAWGIKMTAGDVTTESLKLTITQPTTYKGYVEWDGKYILEKEGSGGVWSEYGKNARTGAVYTDLDDFFGSSGDLNGKAGGSAVSRITFYTGALPNGHYRVKKQFTGNCNNIKGTLSATADFNITNETPRNTWGIAMTASGNACESGVGITVTKTASDADSSEVWTGEAYTVEKLVGGDWEDVEMLSDAVVWDGLGITLKNGEKRSFEINWEEIYGKLPKGTYRIAKTFYTKDNESKKSLERTVYAQFRIDDGGVNIGKYELKLNFTKASSSELRFEVTRTGAYKGEVSWNGAFEIYNKTSGGDWTLYKGKSFMNMESDEDEVFAKGTNKTGFYLTGTYPKLVKGNYLLKIKTVDQTGHIKYFSSEFEIK